MQGVRSLGVLNPKIHNLQHNAGIKTLSPKLPAPDKLPGIHAFSVPVRQKYDWANDRSAHFPYFAFLVTPFLHNNQWHCIANLEQETEAAMQEIFGEEWQFCAEGMRTHFTRHVQYPQLLKSERQVFFPLNKEKGQALIISPMADMLFLELHHELEERKKQGQAFNTITYDLPANDYAKVGVSAARTQGKLTRLFTMPFTQQERKFQPLAPSEAGSFLAIEFHASKLNITGGGIVSGLGSLTSPFGFSEMIQKRIPEVEIEKLAIGYSNVLFSGEQNKENPYDWKYFAPKGAYPGEESQASATVHIILKLKEEIAPHFLDELRDKLATLNYGKSALTRLQIALTANLDAVLRQWGKDVWFLENKQEEIAGAPNRLTAALDKIASDSRYALANTGYQAIEPPRPRSGLRDPNCKHVFATTIASLVRWTPANDVTEQNTIFWQSAWDKTTYSANIF